MIVKSLSIKSDKGVANAIRYVMAEQKMEPKQKAAETRWQVYGRVFDKADLHHLKSESFDARILKAYNEAVAAGKDQKFVEDYLAKLGVGKDGTRIDATVIRNMVRSRSVPGYIKEFKANEALRQYVRKDNVKAYHHIISLSKHDSAVVTGKMMQDLAQKFISLRGNTSLFVGSLHQDKDHFHIHVIQSGTEFGTGKAARTTKSDYERLKGELQEYQKQKYPELKHSLPEHGKQKEERLAKKSNERTSVVLELREKFESKCIATTSRSEFFAMIQQQGYEVYYRDGRPQGILVNGTEKHRFTSLGLDIERLAETEQINRTGKAKELNELSALRYGQKEKSIEVKSNSRLDAFKEMERNSAQSMDTDTPNKETHSGNSISERFERDNESKADIERELNDIRQSGMERDFGDRDR